MRNLRDLSRKLQCFSNKCEFVKCTMTNQVVDHVKRIIIGGTDFNVPLKLFSFKGSHLQSGTKIFNLKIVKSSSLPTKIFKYLSDDLNRLLC